MDDGAALVEGGDEGSSPLPSSASAPPDPDPDCVTLSVGSEDELPVDSDHCSSEDWQSGRGTDDPDLFQLDPGIWADRAGGVQQSSQGSVHPATAAPSWDLHPKSTLSSHELDLASDKKGITWTSSKKSDFLHRAANQSRSTDSELSKPSTSCSTTVKTDPTATKVGSCSASGHRAGRVNRKRATEDSPSAVSADCTGAYDSALSAAGCETVTDLRNILSRKTSCDLRDKLKRQRRVKQPEQVESKKDNCQEQGQINAAECHSQRHVVIQRTVTTTTTTPIAASPCQPSGGESGVQISSAPSPSHHTPKKPFEDFSIQVHNTSNFGDHLQSAETRSSEDIKKFLKETRSKLDSGDSKKVCVEEADNSHDKVSEEAMQIEDSDVNTSMADKTQKEGRPHDSRRRHSKNRSEQRSNKRKRTPDRSSPHHLRGKKQDTCEVQGPKKRKLSRERERSWHQDGHENDRKTAGRRSENERVPLKRRQQRQDEEKFRSFIKICSEKSPKEGDPNNFCMFLAQNQSHLEQLLMDHSENQEASARLISLLHSAVVESSNLCRKSCGQIMKTLKLCAFFESRTVISVVKCLVSTRYRNPVESATVVADQLLDIMEAMTGSHVLPKEDTVVYLGSLQAALRSSKIVVKGEDFTERLLKKAKSIEQGAQQPLSSDSSSNNTAPDFVDTDAGCLVPVLPHIADISAGRRSDLSPRKVSEPFESAAQYVRYVFMSFREDFTGPLCKGICDYVKFVHSKKKNPQKTPKFWNQDVRLYENVHMLGEKLSNETEVDIELQIDTSRIRNFSSRLVYGSLVCLSRDEFQSVVYAMVSERDSETLRKKGVLSVHVLEVQTQRTPPSRMMEFSEAASGGGDNQPGVGYPEDVGHVGESLLQGRALTMLESTAFYTAYFHSLQALQTWHDRLVTRPSSLPFKKQLLQMSKEVKTPHYFEASSGCLSFLCMKKYAPDTERDIRQRLNETRSYIRQASRSPDTFFEQQTESGDESEGPLKDLFDRVQMLEQMLKEQERETRSKYRDGNIAEPGRWPAAAELGLDEAQYAALRLALTQELALIQGPPGTGKTTLGIRVAELLLENERLWREDEHELMEKTPFLLLSYTNHALDQFLTGLLRLPVLKLDPYHHVVRVGSRSENETLTEHNIAKLRREGWMGIVDPRNEKRELDAIRNERADVDRKIQSYKDGIVCPDHLLWRGAMAETHYTSLVNKKGKKGDPMVKWLCLDRTDFGESLNTNKSYIHGRSLKRQVQKNRNIVRQQTRKRQHKQDRTSTRQDAGSSQNCPQKPHMPTADHADLEEGEISDTSDVGESSRSKGPEASKVSVDEEELDTFEDDLDAELEKERRLDQDDLSYEDTDPALWDRPGTSSQHEARFFTQEEVEDDDIDDDDDEEEEEEEETQVMLIEKVEGHGTVAWLLHDELDEHGSVTWLLHDKLSARPQPLERGVGTQIQTEVSKEDRMSEEEADSVSDVWRLDVRQRWRLYRLWLQRWLAPLHRCRQRQESDFRATSRRALELRQLTDLQIMRRARVVAMTTTGAARYAAVLQKLGPRIILVEEAAQVTEAHLLSSLSPSCQHLIMIGDHQQLRPSFTNYSLTAGQGRHHIDISLFERLCRAGVPYQRLVLQHRMRPEISSLLVPTIYSELKDHTNVSEYPNVKGVKANVFFLTHDQYEDCAEDSKSKRNKHEAELLASLYLYLRLQGYTEKDITVLAAYKDQVLLLRALIKKAENDPRLPQPVVEPDFFTEQRNRRGPMGRPAQKAVGTRVVAVDNFQGEENRIILLSLVRSNARDRIGHLREDNRVCVALSRAREGLFVVGNCEMLSRASPACWRPILQQAQRAGHLGTALPLHCSQHDHVTPVSSPRDIRDLCPNGGCSKICEYRRDCGHTCGKICHRAELFHSGPCEKDCLLKCLSGHPCRGQCGQYPCPPCEEKCDRTCPEGHPCKKICGKLCWPCDERCELKLECGHQCQARCGQGCTEECRELEKVQGACGHEFQAPCSQKQRGTASCTVKCDTLLECGHQCPGKCGTCLAGRLHVACTKNCTRVLICGHVCQAKCTQSCPPCRLSCKAKCVHSQKSCNRRCGENCQQCNEPCGWHCRTEGCPNNYRCSKLCWEMCDRGRCDEPCLQSHKCPTCQKKYRCRGLLCEAQCPPACPTCNADIFDIFFGTEDEPGARFYKMPDCQCTLEVSGLDTCMDQKLNSEDDRAEVRVVVCPKCSSPVTTALRYGKRHQESAGRHRASQDKLDGYRPHSAEEKTKPALRTPGKQAPLGNVCLLERL